MNLLWVLPKWPFPVEDGSRKATMNLIEGVGKSGTGVDVVAAVDSSHNHKPHMLERFDGVHSICALNKEVPEGGWKKILFLLASFLKRPGLPLTMHFFRAPEFKKNFREILNQKEWTHIICEGPHIAVALRLDEYCQQHKVRLIYRAQNCEYRIWQSRAKVAANPVEKLFFSWQAYLVKKAEQRLVKKASAVAAITEEEREYFVDWIEARDGTLIETVPFNCPVRARKRREVSDLTVGFLGKLDWYPNRDGLKWFIERVWQEVSAKRDDITLRVAGSGDPGSLSPFLEVDNIDFLGRVDSIFDFFESIDLLIVPIFYGGGVRIKAIEASSVGVPVLGTSLGVEGIRFIPGRSCYVADKTEEWISLLLNLTKSETEEVGEKAVRVIEADFSEKQAVSRFINILCREGS